MVTVSIPTQYGKADWRNYEDYWREEDAEYLQSRSVLRYATSAARAAADQWPSPAAGQVTWNAETDQVEYFTATAPAKWIGVLGSQHLRVTPKTSANDTDPAILGHKGAGGQGLQFWPTVSGENKIGLPAAFLDIGSGAIVAKPTGLAVTVPTTLATVTHKTGAKSVVVTTSATDLVLDSPITAPGATLANIAMSGTLTGGIVNGASGTIGGVTMASNFALCTTGYVTQAGYFSGDANAAFMRYRNPTGGATTANYLRVDNSNLLYQGLGASLFDIRDATLRLFDAKPIQFFSPADVLLGSLGPVVVSATAPTVANYPEGTIWVQP